MRTDNKIEFSERLKALMAEKHLNQVELAEKVGVAQSRISEWRGGKALPQPRVGELLAQALEVEARWLIDGKGAKQHPRFIPIEEILQAETLCEQMPSYGSDCSTDWKTRALAAEQNLADLKTSLAELLTKH